MSPMDRLLSYLEPLIHLTLILLALSLLWNYWSSGNTEQTRRNATVHIDSSEVLSEWRSPERRIFLFVSPTCPYCNRSMDFYARLGRVVDSMQQIDHPVALAAVTSHSHSSQSQRQILRTSNVKVDTLFSLPASSYNSMGVSSVPTVVIHDPTRSLQSTWVGVQKSTGKREILSSVTQTSSSQLSD